MQEFNNDQHSVISNSNAVQLSQEREGTSTLNPPHLFAEPSIQLKEEDGIQEAKEIASVDTDTVNPTSVVTQAKVTDVEKEDGESESQLKLDYSTGLLPPPSKPSSNNNSTSISTPFQLKESKESSSHKDNDSGDLMSKMENSLGADFSSVKINTNSAAAKDAGALAFTQGNQIDFAPGQYNPETSSGQELLGHELTHVVQQREGRVKPTGKVNGMPLNDDKGLEQEADVKGKMAAQSSGLNSSQSKTGNFTLASSPSTQFKLQMHSEAFAIQRQTAGEDSTPVDVDEVAIAKEMISNGAKNENYITDEVFYKRYPGIGRRKLIFPKSTDSEKVLVRDWLRIRNETVRPLLRGEEIPDKEKPDTGKPKKGKPKKEKPKEEKPKEDKPKEEKPEKDKPKKEEPKTPGLDSLIPDLLGITPETFNFGLDGAKAFFELCRLIPGAGIFAGLISGSIQMYQDLMTSIQTGDWFLVVATFGRNAVNLLNGLIGDVGWMLTCLQDLGAAITAASTAGGPLVALIGLCEAFIALCNEVVTLLNFLLDLVMLFLDTLVIVHTSLKLSLAPMTDDERAAHKSLLVGYIGNGAADLISTFLDGLDLASLGLLHGEFIDKFLKAWKGMSFVAKFGTMALSKLGGILAGIIIPGEVNSVQAKPEGEEMEEEGDGLEEILSTFVLANQKFESLDGGAKALLDLWPTFVEQMETKIEEMSDGREPFEVAQEMFDQALAEMESKITSMTFIQDQLASVDSNILIALEEIERVESMIEEISIPEIEVPDIDLGDNPIADGLEGVLEDGANLVVETINKAIRLANEELEEIKDSLRSGIAGFKEELEYVRLVIQESQKVLSAHKEEIRNFIDSTREQLAGCGSFEDLFDKLIGEIGKVLGIDEELDVDTLRSEWDNTKKAVAEGLKQIKELLAGKEDGATSKGSTDSSTQLKPEVDNDPLDTTSESTHSIQKKTNENDTKEIQENTVASQGAFQLKHEPSSPQVVAQEYSPFQLKQNENLNSNAKKKEHDLPFTL